MIHFSTQKDFSATIKVDSEAVTELQIGHDPLTNRPFLSIKYSLLGERQGQLFLGYSDIESIRELGEMIGSVCDKWSATHNPANAIIGLPNSFCDCETCRKEDITCNACKECS